jgi:hypothetical protein
MRSHDLEIKRRFPQIFPGTVLKLTVPNLGMNENSQTPIDDSQSDDHQKFNGAMNFLSIESLVGFRYHCIVFMNVMERFSAQH